MTRISSHYLLFLFIMCCSTSLLAQAELHIAVMQDDQLMVQQLIGAGADLDGVMAGGNTPLIVAAKFGRLEACKLLLDKGAKVNLANEEGNTALMVAVTAGQPKVVQFLISRKASMNIKNREGMTAKDLAVLMGYDDIVKLLG